MTTQVEKFTLSVLPEFFMQKDPSFRPKRVTTAGWIRIELEDVDLSDDAEDLSEFPLQNIVSGWYILVYHPKMDKFAVYERNSNLKLPGGKATIVDSCIQRTQRTKDNIEKYKKLLG